MRIKSINWLIPVFVFAVTFSAAAQPTPTPGIPTAPPGEFTITTAPASLIGAFYNAVSLGDYARAYGYWEAPPQGRSEQEFAEGYADTLATSVIVRLPIFSDAGAGNIHAAVPALVTGVRRDGTTEYYAGCFTLHKTNVPVGDATEPDPNWYIQDGELTQQATLDLAALNTACGQNSASLSDNLTPASTLTPAGAVEAYFTAMVGGTSGAANWQADSVDTFAGEYGTLMSGAGNVELFVNPAVISEGAAGSVYASVPVLLTFSDANSLTHFVTGCFDTRLINVPQGDATEPDPNWHITSATFAEVPDALAAVNTLAANCPVS